MIARRPPRATKMQARFLWRALKARWRDQRAELSIIRNHVRPGDVGCDVGAHKGSYTYWLSRWVGENGRVLAFEPQPSLAAYLQEVALPYNVVIEQKALWSETGALDLFVPKVNSPGASLMTSADTADGTRLQVPVVALDDYLPQKSRISLMKVDAEGAELAIFRGARRVLRESRPLLIFECENRHFPSGSFEDTFSFLAEAGYEGYFFAPDGVRPLSAFNAAIHQSQAGPQFWNRANYCNNFLFRARN